MKINVWDTKAMKQYCEAHGIVLLTYSQMKESGIKDQEALKIGMQYRGFAMCVDDQKYIFIDDTAPTKEERYYTLAHELGHILMGHLSDPDHPSVRNADIEWEANTFSAIMLALRLYDDMKGAGEHGIS